MRRTVEETMNVHACPSCSFFVRKDPRSEAQHPDRVIWIQHKKDGRYVPEETRT